MRIQELENAVEQARMNPSELSPTDLNELRERVLAGLKLGKQAPGYKAAVKALDSFIQQLEAYT